MNPAARALALVLPGLLAFGLPGSSRAEEGHPNAERAPEENEELDPIDLDEIDLESLDELGGEEVTPEETDGGIDDPPEPPPEASAQEEAEDEEQADDAAPLTSVVIGRRGELERESEGRASSVVSRRQLDERLPRSTPDALRYEPGISVQQTAHGQASTYVRGLTGQQTVLLFDGIRLNNATYRQGPNQYFFTVDSHTVAELEVIRGSASVLYGSDALGGVLRAAPREPLFRSTVTGLRVTPRSYFRLTTADDERGGRFELEAQVAQRVAFLGGVGYRRVDLLEGGGVVYGLDPRRDEDGRLQSPEVPRFADDERTQMGTGFDELTFDGRLVFDLGDFGRLTAAGYGYHELDSPRTDQCPPAFAPMGECLVYEEQFRELAYLAWDLSAGRAAEELRITTSYQRQHERTRLDRAPPSAVVIRGVDDAHTAGLTARAHTASWEPADWLGLRLRYGTDLYYDMVDSSASTTFTDVDMTFDHSRGLYLDGSTYLWWGTYAEGEAQLPMGLTLRAGLRLSVTDAQAPGDEETASLPVDQTWVTPVGRGGLQWAPLDWLEVLVNVDQGFRAPNLDDLTSRQQTGPGFQFENAMLEPERSLTVETGLRLDSSRFRAEAYFYWTRLTDAIIRAPRTRDQCPPQTAQCLNSWTRFQLVNADAPSTILGTEAAAYARIPGGFTLRATVAYAFGEGPNPGQPPSDPDIPWQARVPLSRIPPLNGTVELRWHWREVGLFAGAGLRWATGQDRLALSDQGDERIPPGGTPGYALFDLRAGWRFRNRALLALVFENITDEAYRVHGSSINGPGRGLILHLEVGL